MSIDSSNRMPKARADVSVVELDGEMVLYDEVTATVHHLNRSASVLWSLLDGRTTLTETAAEVASVYGIHAEEVETQLHELVDQLAAFGLIQEGPLDDRAI